MRDLRIRVTTLLASVTLAALAASGARAQVSFTGSYTQDFDSLASTGSSATWTDNGTLAGWYSWHVNGAASFATYKVGAGTIADGGIYSFGTAGSTERALGSIGSNNAAVGNVIYGVLLLNTSDQTIDDLSIAYTGEEWRNGGNTNEQVLAFGYLNNGASSADVLNSTSFTTVDALSFTSPTVGASAASLNGNAAANSTAIAGSLTGLNWQAGQYLWLRWYDTNDSGNDHALAIDNLSITAKLSSGSAAPEPGSLALLAVAGFGAVPMVRRRLRRLAA